VFINPDTVVVWQPTALLVLSSAIDSWHSADGSLLPLPYFISDDEDDGRGVFYAGGKGAI